MKNILPSAALALCLTSGLFADSFTISSVNGGAATGSPKLNLDNLTLGNSAQQVDSVVSISFTGDGGVVKGAASGLYAAPFVSGSNGVGFGGPDQLNGADDTKYVSTGIGSIVFNFSLPQTYFGLLWGSVDNYNTLSFYNGGSLVGSFTGLDVWANANGNQGAQGTFYVNFQDTNGTFNKVVASSTQYAFEIDNIAYKGVQQVPESGTTIAFLGLALSGLALWRRRR